MRAQAKPVGTRASAIRYWSSRMHQRKGATLLHRVGPLPRLFPFALSPFLPLASPPRTLLSPPSAPSGNTALFYLRDRTGNRAAPRQWTRNRLSLLTLLCLIPPVTSRSSVVHVVLYGFYSFRFCHARPCNCLPDGGCLGMRIEFQAFVVRLWVCELWFLCMDYW